ncbi:MAG TPA: efflux RND transporter permease subunit, partial [Chromatiaceae bacterium]|nr:efflux RND transporter permease subunit [Chromatiaceae bacterium]
VLKGFMPVLTFVGVILLLFASIALLESNPPKVVFFPETDPLYINAFVDLPIGSDINSTNTLMKELELKVEHAIKKFSDAGIVDAVLSQIGENTADPMAPPEPGATPNKARITVAFVSSDKRKGLSTFEAMDSIRSALDGYAGVSIVVDRNAEGPPTGKPINLEIYGDDKSMRELSIVASDVLNHLEGVNVPGVEELNMNISANVQQDIIEVDREASRRYGLSTLDIAKSLNAALYGREVSQFKSGEDEYPIIIRFAEKDRHDNEVLMNQMVTFRNMDAGGRIVQVPISAVSRKRPSSTYSAVKRKNEKRTITVYSNILAGYNANEVVEELKQIMEDYADDNFPEGYDYHFSGEQEEMAENSAF